MTLSCGQYLPLCNIVWSLQSVHETIGIVLNCTIYVMYVYYWCYVYSYYIVVSVLKTFVHDPLVEWSKVKSTPESVHDRVRLVVMLYLLYRWVPDEMWRSRI